MYRILLVEDDRNIRELNVNHLRKDTKTSATDLI